MTKFERVVIQTSVILIISSTMICQELEIIAQGYPCGQAKKGSDTIFQRHMTCPAMLHQEVRNMNRNEKGDEPECHGMVRRRYRTINGTCNHLKKFTREWGSSFQPYQRFVGTSTVLTYGYPPVFRRVISKHQYTRALPDARMVSTVIHGPRTPQSTKRQVNQRFSALLMTLGQFIDHDLTLTPENNACTIPKSSQNFQLYRRNYRQKLRNNFFLQKMDFNVFYEKNKHKGKDFIRPSSFYSTDIDCFVENMNMKSEAEIDCCAYKQKYHQTVIPKYCMPINIPRNDPFYAQFQTVCLDFKKSMIYDEISSNMKENEECIPTRQNSVNGGEQVNAITSYLDASHVYGSTEERSGKLRKFEKGLLRYSSNMLMPHVKHDMGAARNRMSDSLNVSTGKEEFYVRQFITVRDEERKRGKRETISPRQQNSEENAESSGFEAGDIRVDENPALQGMHVIWFREHNRLAVQIYEKLKREEKVHGPALSENELDEVAFQEARRLVVAEWQNIVYQEFLPIVVGKGQVPGTAGKSKYDEDVNPMIFNGFATAAFRFGHSLIGSIINMAEHSKQSYNDEIRLRFIKLREHFFNTSLVHDQLQTAEILIGSAAQKMQEFDNIIDFDLRNFLFANSESMREMSSSISRCSLHNPYLLRRNRHFGSDLAARNIQRGRDHRLGTYDQYRRACKLSPLPNTFYSSRRPKEIKDHKLWRLLSNLYESPKDIDIFVGALCETSKTSRAGGNDDEGVVGPTFACIISKQFKQLKKGDRYFFTHKNVHSEIRFCKAELEMIRKRTLRDIICENGGRNGGMYTGKIPMDPLRVSSNNDFKNSWRYCEQTTNKLEPILNCNPEIQPYDKFYPNKEVIKHADLNPKDVAVVSGGFNGTHVLKTVELYSPTQKCRYKIAPLPYSIYDHQMFAPAITNDGTNTNCLLMVCGGRSPYDATDVSTNCLCYERNRELGEWHDLKNLNRKAVLHTSRWPSSGVNVDGVGFFLTGGRGSPSTTEMYDYKTKKWSRGPLLKKPRELRHCAVAVGEQIYIIGGTRGPYLSLRRLRFEKQISKSNYQQKTDYKIFVEVIDTKRNESRLINTNTNDDFPGGDSKSFYLERSQHSCVLLADNRSILINEWSPTTSLVYDTKTNRVVPVTGPILNRAYGSTIKMNDRILVLGGGEATQTDTVEEYFAETKRFVLLEATMSEKKSRFAVTTLPAPFFRHIMDKEHNDCHP